MTNLCHFPYSVYVFLFPSLNVLEFVLEYTVISKPSFETLEDLRLRDSCLNSLLL